MTTATLDPPTDRRPPPPSRRPCRRSSRTSTAATPPTCCGWPRSPGPPSGDDEILVRVRAASVDRGTWHIMAGLPYPIRAAGFGLRRPKALNPGRSVAGTVAAVGANVTEFAPGDEVFGTCAGAFAEYAVAEAGTARPQAREPHLRAGGGGPRLGAHRAAGRARPGQGAAGAAGADHRRLGRRRHVRRADRQGLRRRGDRRRQHRQDRPRPLARRRPRRRLHARGLRRRRPPLRRDHRHRRQQPPVAPAPGPHAARHARHRRRRDRRTAGSAAATASSARWRCRRSSARSSARSSPPRTPTDLVALRELVEAGKLVPAIDRTYPLRETAAAIRHVQDGRARGKVVIAV